MNSIDTVPWKKALPYLGIALLPFVLFYWLVPGLSDLTIGNDYGRYAIEEQMELQFALEHGEFPLFIPGFACGRTVAALTLGQLFHPQSHLAALIPGYFDGAALVINTMLRLLSLAGVHLALFVLLRRLKLKTAVAFVLSMIAVYNLRMLDLFRYGASLENYTGHLFLIAALAALFLRPRGILSPVAVIASAYLVLCGGHPQMMYFGLLSAVIVGGTIPFVLPAIEPSCRQDRATMARYYKTALLCLCAAGLLSAPYILPFVTEFLRDNAVRVDRGYRWSLSNTDNTVGVIANFFDPLRSDVHGAFGGSALLILLVWLPILRLRGNSVPRGIWVLFGAVLFVVLCSFGARTPVHFWFWKLFPLAGSFRTPGRIAMILTGPAMLLLAFLFRLPPREVAIFGRRFSLTPAAEAAAVALLLLAGYFGLSSVLPEPARWSPLRLEEIPSLTRVLATAAAALTLASLLLLGIRTRFSSRTRQCLAILMCAAALYQTGVSLRHGTWQVQRKKSRTYASYLQSKRKDLRTKVTSGYGMESAVVTEQIRESVLAPHLARFYRDVTSFSNDKDVRRFLRRERRARQAVMIAPRESLPKCVLEKPDKLELIYSSLNRLSFQVVAQCPGLLALGFPYESDWEVGVDEKDAAVYKTNGYELGVRVPAGRHIVTFRYSGASHVLGFRLSGATLVIIGIFFAIPLRSSSCRRALIVAGILGIVGTATAFVPALRMYGAPSFETRYRWTSEKLPPNDNLAFAKKTVMSPMKSNENPYYQYSGRAVDGSRGAGGFWTNAHQKAWWQVDLGRAYPIRTVVLYGDPRTPLPFTVSASADGRSFVKIAEVRTPEKKRWKIETDTDARFIRITRPEAGSFTLKEVEVY